MNSKRSALRGAVILLVLAFTVAWLAAGCRTQKVESYWAARPMRIDGQIADWGSVPLSYFKDSDIQLGLCNDDTNLYVLFCTYSARWMQAIRKGGLTLWFDDSGKKKKIFGLRYVGGPPPSELEKSSVIGGRGWPGSSPGGTFGDERGPFSGGQTPLSDQLTIIRKEKDKTTTLLAGPTGAVARAGVSEDVYAYEFSVPLRGVTGHDSVFVIRPGETIYIGLEVGGKGEGQPSTKEMAGYRGGDWGMGPGGGGFGGGRGGRAGGMPGGRGDYFGPLGKQEIWVTTFLASAPPE